MKKIFFIMALVLLQIRCFAVTVETTTNLNVYYPEFSKIDLGQQYYWHYLRIAATGTTWTKGLL